jgi:hypothetical protein
MEELVSSVKAQFQDKNKKNFDPKLRVYAQDALTEFSRYRFAFNRLQQARATAENDEIARRRHRGEQFPSPPENLFSIWAPELSFDMMSAMGGS